MHGVVRLDNVWSVEWSGKASQNIGSLECFLIFSLYYRTPVQCQVTVRTGNMSDQRYSSLAARLQKYGQSHVLQWWEELDEAGREQLAGELEELDLEEMEEMYRKSRDR